MIRTMTTSKGATVRTDKTDREAIEILTRNYLGLTPFGRSLHDQYARTGRLSDKQWPYAHKIACEFVPVVEQTVVVEHAPDSAIGTVRANVETITLVERVAPAPTPAPVETVDLSRVIEMLASAATHLRRPSIRYRGLTFRRRNLGGVSIYANRIWIGNANPTFALNQGRPTERDAIRAMAADPIAATAAEGRVTGSCCFCRRTLTDARSTAVGYGPVCADHFNLPWGETGTRATAPETVAVGADSFPLTAEGEE